MKKYEPTEIEPKWSQTTSSARVRGKQEYNPSAIEKRWQDVWEKVGIYKPDLDKAQKPYFNLMMFPYPSAEGLHVGNMYAFTGADVYGRFKKMQGYDVFEPIGLDGFGIHSENYALKIGRHPAVQAKISEKNFYRQLHNIGNAYDWSRTVETYDPDYYKWTQWIFIKMFKAGLAYRKKSPVNFCPQDKTVLADEQVIDGKCERCSSVVEKRELEQWFFKITAYADRLLDGLSKITWTEKVKIAQRQWIGRKEGINIKYQIAESKYQVECWTSRPDTNFGATFIVLAPEHPFVAELLKLKTKIKEYVEKVNEMSEEERVAQGREKTGAFTGLYAVNDLTGQKMPIWVSDFVLMGFGTGAVVGVPGHDKRDFEFAQKFGLPIKRVVVGTDGDDSPITKIEQVQEEEGKMVNSGFLDGMDIRKAKEKIMDYIAEKGWGKKATTYHLRDWLISRQRYWGPPIPMIYCEKCNWQSVPEEDLPVLLPDVKDWKPKGTGKSPLASVESFVKTQCPNCKGEAVRETDVSDTFLDSAWYFFRYTSTDDNTCSWKPERVQKWLPVDMYIGGAEHSVLHLLYVRFLTMAFKDMKLVSFEEPFPRFYAHGLLIFEGAKMSKSKGNVIVPDKYIEKYGADTLRCYLMFLGPFSQGGDFRDTGIEGMYKFLKRVWKLVSEYSENSENLKVRASDSQIVRHTESSEFSEHTMHKTIKKVTEDMENLRYNTAIAALMEWYNYLAKSKNPASAKASAGKQIAKVEIETYLKLLAPFAPHMTEELWSFGFTQNEERWSIHQQTWPKYDPKLVQEEEVTIVVQVNGKVRDSFQFPASSFQLQKKVEKEVLKREKVKKYLKDKVIEKVIYVPGKIINFVVTD